MNEIMAHHDSAKKRIRQTERRTERNRARMSRVRTFFKKVELAISSGDKDAARQALIEAQPEIHRGVTRGVIHRNTAARKLSRLSARVKAL
jgi:small subunit ribosomal protein S20